ncbi:Monooxygenase FAD-binding [Penicillium alfredii]|uniref:Monooxygenase FAD-binding n=1 Tax=Penicillium alfredii TaxID=1506179 RepID=A0A9W9GB93_9EURO|nr:Monooxygenase FAD-binding [Penicillium alfredii]KAJ5114845.1 Monooxygenase FAD-binding [Penicillium alfredii]
MPETDVLIIGAGPTGLVLALWLHRQGINVHIVDQAEAAAKNSRALVVHARIVELYQQLGLTDDLLAVGHQLPATNIWVGGHHRAHIPLQEFGQKLTPYPFMLTLPQDEHERLLERRLKALGVTVERRTRLLNFVDHGSNITATLLCDTDESEMTYNAAYIVGCDGAHSAVRHGIGTKYEGDAYKPFFYIADIEGDGDSPFFNGEAHVTLTNESFYLVIPYAQRRHARLVGVTLADDNATYDPDHTLSEHHPQITFDDILPQVKKALNIKIEKLNWFSTYRSHHRVAEKFRDNRAFIVGDAAHIHSPVGGQGMNTGIMDAINLAWKLATVIKQTEMTEDAKSQLLESYETERRAFAMKIVSSTDTGFTTFTAKGIFPHILRTWIIPYLAPVVTWFSHTRTEMFRAGSQLICTYRGSGLSQAAECTAAVHPGDRLPWAKTQQDDNFSTLSDICWQLHVYGDQQPGLGEWCLRRNVKLFVFDWDEQHAKAGLKKDVVYLLRPDHYIAGIFEGDSVESALDDYFSSRGLAC